MQDIFNSASLAKLSRSELFSLLAGLSAKCASASSANKKAALERQIAAVRLALSLSP